MKLSKQELWRALPAPAQDAVSMTMARIQGEKIPPPPEPKDRPIRLMIAPANYAGQGYRWARAAERNPRIAAMNMVIDSINPFRYPADNPVPGRIAAHSRAWQEAQFQAIVGKFTHMLIEAEMRPLGSAFGRDLLAQARAIQAGGVRLAMVCHGNDIRLPSRHAALEKWSPFVDDSWVPVAALEKVVEDNLAVLRELGVPVFVSTAGLLLDVPDAHLLPVVIDPEPWANVEPALRRARPVVLHIPSNPLVKGTAQILPGLQRLDERGVIELRRVSGVGHDEMPGIFRSADVVLDQFRLGDYGVAACEAMAAGRLVVSHVSDQVRGVVGALGGGKLPIVEANLESVESVLREITANLAHYRGIAAAGPAFVRAVHDGARSRHVLEAQFLLR